MHFILCVNLITGRWSCGLYARIVFFGIKKYSFWTITPEDRQSSNDELKTNRSRSYNIPGKQKQTVLSDYSFYVDIDIDVTFKSTGAISIFMGIFKRDNPLFGNHTIT